jgi:hypothetical protein
MKIRSKKITLDSPFRLYLSWATRISDMKRFSGFIDIEKKTQSKMLLSKVPCLLLPRFFGQCQIWFAQYSRSGSASKYEIKDINYREWGI